ncbi:hypothetical protein [Dubosiella newyorkensis]|uniref:hypothetical protein n=1 Tax=Dubosiella newyorkensis TaxID=1862672 RepID=UPI003F66A1EB
MISEQVLRLEQGSGLLWHRQILESLGKGNSCLEPSWKRSTNAEIQRIQDGLERKVAQRNAEEKEKEIFFVFGACFFALEIGIHAIDLELIVFDRFGDIVSAVFVNITQRTDNSGGGSL